MQAPLMVIDTECLARRPPDQAIKFARPQSCGVQNIPHRKFLDWAFKKLRSGMRCNECLARAAIEVISRQDGETRLPESFREATGTAKQIDNCLRHFYLSLLKGNGSWTGSCRCRST